MNSIKKAFTLSQRKSVLTITQESRDSWAVQWLRLRFPMQSGFNPGQGSKIPGCQKAKHKTGAVVTNSTDILKMVYTHPKNKPELWVAKGLNFYWKWLSICSRKNLIKVLPGLL